MPIHLGHIISCKDDDRGEHLHSLEDGAIVVSDEGKILRVCDKKELTETEKQQHPTINWGKKLILPGFVDTHVHSPQIDMIGSFGEELLEWLNRYTFPHEEKYRDTNYARKRSNFFVNQQLRNGTTTSCIFASSHTPATIELLKQIDSFGVRAFVGKVTMDQSAPDDLICDLEKEPEFLENLISTWHNKSDLVSLVLTPRFALSCTPRALKILAEFKEKYPDILIQTHISENLSEVAAVKNQFPKSSSYAAVYDEYGLLTKDTILAHAIHTTDEEWQLFSERKCKIAHCPTSNMFLGSGLFNLDKAKHFNVEVSLASDVGAGTSLNMWKTMLAAYQVAKLQGLHLKVSELFYLATAAGASCLGIHEKTGTLEANKDADFQIVNPANEPMLKDRTLGANADEIVFSLVNLADDRVVENVFVKGREVYHLNDSSRPI